MESVKWYAHDLTTTHLEPSLRRVSLVSLIFKYVLKTDCKLGRPQPSVSPYTANGSPAFPRQAWNPAALLDPRAIRQPPSQTPLRHASKPQDTPQQLAFQFTSNENEPLTSYGAHSSSQRQTNGSGSNGITNYGNGFANYANANSGTIGMGDFMSRGTINRSDVPQTKRRKISEDPEQKKAEFHGGGNGSILGAYMKEQRDEGKKLNAAAGTAPGAVSIIDDDDDVEVVGDEGDKEVCYGRIEGAEVNAFKVPTAKPGTVALSNQYWPQVKIVLRRRHGERGNVIHVVDSTRDIIGCVDVNTSIGLTPLLDSPSFKIRTASRILYRVKKPDDPLPGTAVSKRYNLDLNLYGPKKYALNVGRHLSQKQIWLRGPLFVEPGISVHNPHEIQKPQQPAPRYGSYYSGARVAGPARTTEEIRNDVLGMFDSLERSENLQEMEPNYRISTELLKHQKQGLTFMTNKEKERIFSSEDKVNSSLWRLRISRTGERIYYNVITGDEERKNPPQVLGGILADMMGLGKTLSILSLITYTMDNEASQWANQKPCVQENRDCGATRKGKTALPSIEQVPLVLNAKTTLLVSPLSTISNWEEQIKQHVKPGTLKYYVYHGANRIKDVKKLAEYDLVITTYGSVASEFNHRSKKKQGVYPLEEINWFRIVLDEAHMIREQSTQQSKAICRLAANRRWAVTGTPVQNRLEDLGALMAFLRIKPFDDRQGFSQYIMSPFKMCDPEILPKLRLLVDSITLRRLKDRIDLPARHDHLVKLDFSDEERSVYEVFAKNANDRMKVIIGEREKSLAGKTYVHILQSILRLRLICAHGRDLLNEEDLKVMNGLSKDSAIDLDSDDEDDAGGLSAKQAYDMYNLMKETNNSDCLLCSGAGFSEDNSEKESKDEIIGYMTPCFHFICNNCIDRYKSDLAAIAQGQSRANCPICHTAIKPSCFALRQQGVDEEEGNRVEAKVHGKPVKNIDNYSGPHTKTKALMHDLQESGRESEAMPDEPPIKSVVFSGWTAHLDLIQLALQEHGIKYVRLDGKMSRVARGAALDRFRDDPSIIVILVSIMAGGLGLNLTTANKVYVMEPQYNPAAEAQAVDRVHRLGQKREVVTVRYIMNDSFEEKMLELQDKKKKLATLSMDGDGKGRIDKAEAARKRLEDLRSLFK
jgi:SNF2 family DNA or RNA helicase